MEMVLKDSSSQVRESVSVDSLATGTVLRETTTHPPSNQQMNGACSPPETCLYFFLSLNLCIFRPNRSTVNVDAAFCYRWNSEICLSVGLSLTNVSRAKTAEPIEVPFVLWTRVGPRSHVLDGDPDSPMQWGNLRGKGWPIVKYGDLLP